MVVKFLSRAILATSDSDGNGLGGGGGALLTLICTSNLGSIGTATGCRGTMILEAFAAVMEEVSTSAATVSEYKELEARIST